MAVKWGQAIVGIGIALFSVINILPGDELFAVPVGALLVLDAFDVQN